MKIAMIVLLAVAGLFIAGAFVAGPQLTSGWSSLRSTPKGTRVRFQTVANGKLVETVKAPGKIEPRTKVDISAEVAARVEQLPFREGQEVRKGDVIVQLDARNFQAEFDMAKARSEGEAYRLQSQQAQLTGTLSLLAFARKEMERKQKLFDSGDLSSRDLDDAISRVNDLQSQVDSTKFMISVIESSLLAAKADIDRATEGLSKTTIRAPMDGVITALNAEVGEVVLMGTMNNPGTVIMTVADLSRMILRAEVAESDVAQLAVNQPAKVHINAYRDEVFSGTVTQVALQRTDPREAASSSSSGSSTGYFEAEIEIDLRGRRILSGLMANVDVEVAAHDGLLVESQAVVDRTIEDLPDEVKLDNPLVDRSKKTTTVVYRVIDGKAKTTAVRRGSSDDTQSIILAGLSDGDIVIIGPFKALEKLKHDEAVLDESTMPKDDKSKPESAEEKGGPSVRVRMR